ncbi:hypothetical protein, partial [Acinetobacter baumannii]|uniref:hypothetical protein n=1 Tax=Acinetobacter baumannii TaxID=470 RepID=UPI00196AA5F5
RDFYVLHHQLLQVQPLHLQFGPHLQSFSAATVSISYSKLMLLLVSTISRPEELPFLVHWLLSAQLQFAHGSEDMFADR